MKPLFRIPILLRRRRRSAFSLVEILVTVALLSFIVLGLLAMFHQTQRAFRSSITQTDVLEAGRALTEIIGRELEQMRPCPSPYAVNGNFWFSTNFFAEIAPGFDQPLLQDLPGVNVARTNVVQRFFFLTRESQRWEGIGYQVLPDVDNSGVGTLYRFQATAPLRHGPVLSGMFKDQAALARQNVLSQQPVTNLSRMVDGVVHLRVRAFATNGFIVTRQGGTNGFWVPSVAGKAEEFIPVPNTAVFASSLDPAQIACYFVSNAVPAFVELELGILEPQVLQRYRALGSPEAQRNFLSNRVAQVHLFRQRIPIRNVDFKVYQ